ncbi:MAG TPA: bifunctional diguanylate cyclase/phosphodiesterase [Saliniramus sp.]|nr:bifunctional diguanylate cyclase/phosphodiesterase [Saliniramus sp.]
MSDREALRSGSARGRPGETRLLDPRSILTSIGEVVYDWDIGSDAIAWSANASEVFQIESIDPLGSGRAFGLLVDPGSGVSRQETVMLSKQVDQGGGVPYRTRYSLALPGGRTVSIDDTGRWFAGSDGRPTAAHGVIRIGEADKSLLGTRDRSAFIESIAGDVMETRHLRRHVTMIVASIDSLDRINEQLGYEGGDEVIVEVSRRVHKVMRRRDKLARYASNRFAVALMSCPADQVHYATQRLCEAVSSVPIETTQGPFPVELRIGAACAPDHAEDAATLMRRAEDALTLAKRTVDTHCVIFDPKRAVEQPYRRTTSISAPDVVDALNQRLIVFVRQPIVRADTREVAFGEALARIARPAMPLLSAGEIIPVVERAGLISLLDTRMLELTTQWLAQNPRERLSINLSPMTLERPDWLPTLAGHLGSRPGVASRLIIEVTETIAVGDVDLARARLEAMKELGVSIAIDDFGAGHTSFRHLRNFPVDMLKIDGAFVQNLARSPDDRFFVRTLIDLAHHLCIPTVAEWVEDEESARMLADWGVDYLQGDHCGKPEMLPRNGSAFAEDAPGAAKGPVSA